MWFLIVGVHVSASFASTLLIVPLSNILQSLPISIAGWGVRESFFVAAYGSVGVAAPPAVAVSVIFGLLVIVSSLPGGVLWLFQGAEAPQESSEGSGRSLSRVARPR